MTKCINYIMCAAIWIDDAKNYPHQPQNISSGIVVCGRRHCNCFASISKMWTKEELIPYRQQQKVIQGFLTSENVFLTRDQSVDIAFDAGQIDQDILGCVLTSEDLW